jgi:hypothetical protein
VLSLGGGGQQQQCCRRKEAHPEMPMAHRS